MVNPKSKHPTCNDIIEIIYDSQKGIVCKIYGDDQLDKARAHLEQFDIPDLVLDLHGVLDTVDPQTSFQKYTGCTACCSFVGKHSSTREWARNEMSERILAKQIKWGVMVFKRKRNKKGVFKICHTIGSKAWFCKAVGARYFIDDCRDHVESVNTINGTETEAFQLGDGDELLKLLDAIWN